jgi:hypothetical protein
VWDFDGSYACTLSLRADENVAIEEEQHEDRPAYAQCIQGAYGPSMIQKQGCFNE